MQLKGLARQGLEFSNELYFASSCLLGGMSETQSSVHGREEVGQTLHILPEQKRDFPFWSSLAKYVSNKI